VQTSDLRAQPESFQVECRSKALRPKKGKSTSLVPPRALVDFKPVKAFAGKGGDGMVSFLQAWANDHGGPDGGDGGNGGDVIFEVN